MRYDNKKEDNRRSRSSRDRGSEGRRNDRDENRNKRNSESLGWNEDSDGRSADYDQGNYGRSGYGSYNDNLGYGSGNYERDSFGGTNQGLGRGYGNDPESYENSYERGMEGKRNESGYDRNSYSGRGTYDSRSENSGLYGNGHGQNSGNWGFGRSWDRTEEDSNRTSDYRGGNSWGNGQRSDRSSESYVSNRGKGPKGYQRSDERIREDVNDCLSDDDQIDASEIEVKVEKGEVTLSGSVSDRNLKRRAEDLVEAVSGVKNVENRIRVKGSTSKEEDSSTSRDESSRSTTGSATNKSNDRSKIRESVA